MSITITAEAEAKIREKVESGQYDSADAVIGEALRLLDWQEREHAKLLRLRELIDEGDEGEAVPLTREIWEASLERAKQRVRAGETPDPDVALVGPNT